MEFPYIYKLFIVYIISLSVYNVIYGYFCVFLIKNLLGGPHYWDCSYATPVVALPGVACEWSLFAASQAYTCTDSCCVVGEPCALVFCVSWRWNITTYIFCAVGLCDIMLYTGPLGVSVIYKNIMVFISLWHGPAYIYIADLFDTIIKCIPVLFMYSTVLLTYIWFNT